MRRSSDLWVLLGLFVAVVAVGLIVSRPPPQEATVSTTYNADPKGVKAFYVLLGERLGYRVGRHSLPFTELPADARLLFVIEPLEIARITDSEARALESWVQSGGTAVLAASDSKRLPGEFRRSREYGKGRIVVLRSVGRITNRGMRNPDNALDLLRIVDSSAGRQGLVLFDEYHHGLGSSGGGSEFGWHSIRRQVKVAAVLLLLAGLVLCHTRGKRFGEVRPPETASERRSGFEFVLAAARLYRAARATDVAAEVLCRSFRHQLTDRLGLAPDAPPSEVARQLGPLVSPETLQSTGRLLEICDTVEAGQKPSELELVNIAREVTRLEQELGIGAVRG